MHQGGREVQVTWKTAGPVRQRLTSSPAQYQEGKACMGAAWEATLEGRGGVASLRKVLSCVSAGGTLFWSVYMGYHGDKDSEVRGSACDFLKTFHM